MPTGSRGRTVHKDEEAEEEEDDEKRFDAALAIAALSNVSWSPVRSLGAPGPGTPRRRTEEDKKMRRTSAEKRPASDPSSTFDRVGRGGKRRRRGKQMMLDQRSNGDNSTPLSTVSKDEDEDRGQGKFVRSALQTAVINTNGQALTAASSATTPCVNSSLNLVNFIGNKTADANQGMRCLDKDVTPVIVQLVQFPLTTSASSGLIFRQLNNTQNNSCNISAADPQLIQLLMQQPHLISGNFNCLNNSSELNQSTLAKAKDEIANSSDSTPQLPGSLSSLRDYYINVPQVSGAGVNVMPVSTSLMAASHLMTTPNTQQTEALSITEKVIERASSKTDSENSEQNLHLFQRTDELCSQPENTLGNKSVSLTGNRDSNAGEINSMKMPGSLNILRNYYSSLSQIASPPQTALLLSSSSQDSQLTIDNLNSTMTATVSNEAVLNLSMHYQHNDESRVSNIGGCGLNLGIQQNQAIQQNSGHKPLANSQLQTPIKKPAVNLTQNTQYFASLQEAKSKPQISVSPLRILPKIKEISDLPETSNQNGGSRKGVQQTESTLGENSICSDNLSPIKQNISNVSPLQLDNCKFLMGEEVVSFQEYLSRLNGSNCKPQTVDLARSENVYLSTAIPSSSSSFLSPVLSNGVQLIENQSQCISVDEFGNVTLQLDRAPETPSTTNCILLPDVATRDNTVPNAAISNHILSPHGKRKSSLDDFTDKKKLPMSPTPALPPMASHPILQPDEDGDLPLHIAVAHGKREVVKHLTHAMNKLNATIDCRNFLRQTPLHLGVVTGDCEIVELLLGAGASPNIADRKGQNCFHLAVQYRQTQCLQRLFTCCSESQPDILNYEGLTALHLAVKLNQLDDIVVLLRNGARADTIDGKSGHTALYMAADGNRLKAAEVLLSLGADTQITSYSGCSPLQAASAKSFHEMIKLLTKHGASSEQSSQESKQS